MRIVCLCLLVTLTRCYDPTWESLDTRPLPTWYDEAKLGIFIHWGVFSVPSFKSEWFWKNWHDKSPSVVKFMNDNYPPRWTYADFAKDFTAEFYDPVYWAKLFKSSGAKYIVLTSKHHEGYTLWPSKYSFSWNAMDVGPKRDLLGDLAKAIRNETSIKFGVYHSLFEWFNPLYLNDKKNGFTTRDFVTHKTMPELYELVNTYEPEVIWSDGEWEASYKYWNSTGFISWLYNDSPVKDTIVTNDRWGMTTLCKHGDFYTCQDRYQPGKLVNHKWESCMTLDKGSWGFRREAVLSDYLTPEEVISTLVRTVSYGGNLLLNVGPTHDGRIPTIMEERLRQLGQWMDINGEAIYKSKPWSHQNDTLSTTTWYTQNGAGTVYAISLGWPKGDFLVLGAVRPTKTTVIRMLGVKKPLAWKTTPKGLIIWFPDMADVPSKWAYTLSMTKVKL